MRVFLPLRLQQQKNQKERQLFIEQQEQKGNCRNTAEGQTEALEKEDGKESNVAHPYSEENFERKEGSNESEDDNQEESHTQEEGHISNSFGSEEENNHNSDTHEDTNIAVTQNSNQIGDTGEAACNHTNRRIGNQLEESTPIRRVASSTNRFGNHCGSDKSECLGLNPTESPLESSGSSASKQQTPAADLKLSSVLISAETSLDKTCGVSVAGTECLSSSTYSSRGGTKKRKEQEVDVSTKGDTIQSNNKKVCSSTIDIELNHQRNSLKSDTTKEGNQEEFFNSEEIPVNTLSASGEKISQYPSSPKVTPTLSNPESSLRNKSSNLDVDQVNPLLIKSSSLYSDCEKKVPIQRPGSPKGTPSIFVPSSSPKQSTTQDTASQTSKVTDHNTRKSPNSHLDSKQAALSETNITLTLNSTGVLKKAPTPLVSKESSSTKLTTTSSPSNSNLNHSGTKRSMGIGKGLGDFYISQLQQKSDDGRVENDSNDREGQSNPAMGSNILNAASYEDRAHINTNSLTIRDRSQFDLPLSSVSTSSTSANVASSSVSKMNGHNSELNSKPSSKHPQREQSDFSEALKKRGLEEVEQEGDGNCLFRAVSLQVYGDADAHMDVRRRCMDFMGNDQEHFSQFVTDEPFQEYVLRKRQDGVHGNNPEIQVISELYNRPVEVFVAENGVATPINIFQLDYKTGDTPIRLSYHDGNHYNAIIDPFLPTAGLGLGLPGLEPGLADKMQLKKAVDESTDQFYTQKIADNAHDMELKRALEESMRSCQSHSMMMKKKATLASSFSDDLDETGFDMEQAAVLRSLETYQRAECSRKQSWNQSQTNNITNSMGVEDGTARLRQSPPDHENNIAASTSLSSNVASIPVASLSSTSSIAAAVHTRPEDPNRGLESNDHQGIPSHLLRQNDDEYPQTVQELVMNGFELQTVLSAYDLIGDNFDNLLSYLMATSTEG